MYGILLCGGCGSRLWPLSREQFPKQLLTLTEDISLLQSNYKRLQSFIPSDNIYAVTGEKYLSDVLRQLKIYTETPKAVTEPVGKNTAPAIAMGTKYIKQQTSEDPVIIVMPSDHYIKDLEAFKNAVKEAENFTKDGYIVTFGITPAYPETGFGYIKANGNEVEKFVEKPNKETAVKYLEDGNYFWNGGIFVFKASTLFEELKKYAPDIYEILEDIEFNSNKADVTAFEKMPNISIDYAVMEKTDKIKMVKLDCGWSDVGNFKTIYDISPKDDNNNVVYGQAELKDCKNSMIYSTSKLVCASGIENTIIIETPDAVLVSSKDETQKVKDIFESLKSKENPTVKCHKTVYRPWGFYTNICENKGYLVKRILVNPKQALSIQSHNHRAEHWTVIKGKAKVVLDNNEHILEKGQSIDIPLKAIHSLQNPFDEDLEIIEVQMGDILLEEDIIRYSDIYGRC
ncbi:mannose-1-phosphate guanylyltransferase/mannose-6-phosphate isomerase [bacterium]|nr:mannose-1-phosphate guanylyltransferase/mannose-6-phosphate isomerase [bacterium]